jgi:hypothetical protein
LQAIYRHLEFHALLLQKITRSCQKSAKTLQTMETMLCAKLFDVPSIFLTNHANIGAFNIPFSFWQRVACFFDFESNPQCCLSRTQREVSKTMDEKIPGKNMNRIRRYALPTDFKENKVLEQVDLKFSRNSK